LAVRLLLQSLMATIIAPSVEMLGITAQLSPTWMFGTIDKCPRTSTNLAGYFGVQRSQHKARVTRKTGGRTSNAGKFGRTENVARLPYHNITPAESCSMDRGALRVTGLSYNAACRQLFG
jgi:hypothetical protein